MKTFCLEVAGDFACFTRPEMKVERVSYDVITPSAARAVFEAILWKPAIRWQVTKIEVLKPIKWINLRRNEVGAVTSSRNVQTAINNGSGDLGLYIEDERQQRAGLFLRDVAYRIHARFELRDSSHHKKNYPHLVKVRINDPDEQHSADAANIPAKFLNMFERRASKGQCVNQPYLGCREFAASFRLIKDASTETPPIAESRDLGWMLHDMDYSDPSSPNPYFFRAEMKNGVLNLADVEVRG
ncbi:type I-C CRISPR-associated protein Cas5c [Candidatus Nitrotoga fabula]|uniref:pre-crRNA processing endonuclease n=1 Tax=Candidatus Nitrotoga fabula TaxID=2182327 RepID=A0A916BBB1_9PROT|nr:type I-C CRISPR-associated protein Cas5c [Candidatus Nitrotoga fabula]CAE6688374.1 CRISPR pre-crRNA endoribonuclease Cas5d [Candidatus Nitrotoga fabula]